jgi:hypothetical protein
LKAELWASEQAWTGDNESGWFRATRTLPLILSLLAGKKVSGSLDPTRVYLELLARHIDSGVVEMVSEGEHSYGAGYIGTRGIRTWQERMAVLEKNGFIKTKSAGNLRFKYVLLIHPAIAVQNLRDQGKLPEGWWDNYRVRQIEAKETLYEKLVPPPTPANVVPMKRAQPKQAPTVAPKSTKKKAK